jgi:hypothetical protein
MAALFYQLLIVRARSPDDQTRPMSELTYLPV